MREVLQKYTLAKQEEKEEVKKVEEAAAVVEAEPEPA
jgi:hypothetical protein